MRVILLVLLLGLREIAAIISFIGVQILVVRGNRFIF